MPNRAVQRTRPKRRPASLGQRSDLSLYPGSPRRICDRVDVYPVERFPHGVIRLGRAKCPARTPVTLPRQRNPYPLSPRSLRRTVWADRRVPARHRRHIDRGLHSGEAIGTVECHRGAREGECGFRKLWREWCACRKKGNFRFRRESYGRPILGWLRSQRRYVTHRKPPRVRAFCGRPLTGELRAGVMQPWAGSSATRT